jgi:uncharacterized protein YggU (UPF0235/DUF167 family)
MKFSCKVISRSSKDEVVGIENLYRLGLDFVKKDQDMPEVRVYTKAVPVDGRANKEVIRLLAEALKKPKTRVRIIRGEKSNKKIIEVDD